MKIFSVILIGVLLSVILLVSCQTKSNHSSSDKNSTQVSYKTAQDHFDTNIGQVINGDFVLMANINEKVSDWEDAINTGSLNLSFNNVSIEIDDGKYFLTGIDESAKATSRIKLVLSSGNFYEAKYKGDAVGSSSQGGYCCTCSGCTSTGHDSTGECSPKQDENGWYCTSCSQGTCVKTISFVADGIVSR